MIRAVIAQRILIVDLICSSLAPPLFYLHPRYIFDGEEWTCSTYDLGRNLSSWIFCHYKQWRRSRRHWFCVASVSRIVTLLKKQPNSYVTRCTLFALKLIAGVNYKRGWQKLTEIRAIRDFNIHRRSSIRITFPRQIFFKF